MQAVEALVAERIGSRRPAAYLTGRMWFAGHEFAVDERVLVPRSPLAELIEQRFEPWLGRRTVGRALDLGTGSGCIAVGIAHALPGVAVDATDISRQALAVAARNVAAHGLDRRIALHHADLWPPGAARYDLIVSNPPYVPQAVWRNLPAEFHAEPELALVAGEDGCACLDRLLAQAAERLTASGLLFVEVGEIWPAVAARYPQLPFTWLEFERGGEGVFVLERAALAGIAGTA